MKTMTNAKYHPKDHMFLAVLFMFFAMFLFTTANTFVKTLGELTISPVQIVFFRNLVPMILVGLFFLFKQKEQLKISKSVIHAFGFRSVFSTTGLSALFYAYMHGNLSDVTAISFTSPLFVSILAVPLLQESLTRNKLIGLFVGFLGALIVTRPTGDISFLPAIFALIYAMSGAYLMVTDRRLRHHYNSVEILFYFSLGCVCVSFFPMVLTWYTPSWIELGILIVVGVLGGLAQLCIAMAYRRAVAAVVAPVAYVSVVIAAVFNYFLFEVLPTAHLMIGSTLIAFGGIYILFNEKRQQRTRS